MTQQMPHLRIVVAFSTAAIIGYAIFSAWAVIWSNDPALRGDTIGTWKSFGVLAFGFWLGSSSGGKASTGDPQPVTVTNPPSDPVNTTETQP